MKTIVSRIRVHKTYSHINSSHKYFININVNEPIIEDEGFFDLSIVESIVQSLITKYHNI